MDIVAGEKTTAQQDLSVGTEYVLRFVRQFSVKLKAGLSLDKCLAALGPETRNRRLRLMCSEMREAIAKGGSLSQAMRGQGTMFDACVVGLIERGEQTRNLRAALASVADYLDSRGRLEKALRGAVGQPLDVLLFVLLAIFIATVVLSFLVKEFVPVTSAGQHVALTILDRIAFTISKAVRVAWPFVGVFGFLCFLSSRLLPRRPATRAWLDAVALRLPLLGSATRSTAIAVLSRTIGIRMQAGNTLAQAMEVAVVTANNLSVRDHIVATIQRIQKGMPYIDALVDAGFLRLGDVTAVQGAERRGELGALMLSLAADREREAVGDVKTLRSVTHTLVVALLGLAILGVVLTLYVPVFVAH